MLTTYYAYRRLAEEWRTILVGDRVGLIYSGTKNELTMQFAAGRALTFGTQRGFRYLFLAEGRSKPRRNISPLLQGCDDLEVTGLEIADRDRLLYVYLGDEEMLVFVLYGSRPNVLHVRQGSVVDTFKQARSLIGVPPPAGRPGIHPDSVGEFHARVSQRPGTVGQTISRSFVLFDRVLAAEVACRAGLDPEDPLVDASAAEALFRAARELEEELDAAGDVRVYWSGEDATAFSLVALQSRGSEREERFESADTAVRVFCRRMLRQARFSERYNAILTRVSDASAKAQRRLRELEVRLDEPSRAERYERWGHLLMSSGQAASTGSDSIRLPDLFEGGGEVTIPLNPEMTVVENANRYYERARRARLSRVAAAERLDDARRNVRELELLSRELEGVGDLDSLGRFAEERGSLLAAASHPGGAPGSPGRGFRRFMLAGDYEVLVGRSARENDELTFHHARKFDIWMHARGVAGSHVVLRLRGRDDVPPGAVLEKAASVAAFFSKARGSELVPVAYAPRKFVRKPRGATSGEVIVEREKVVIVRPGLPS